MKSIMVLIVLLSSPVFAQSNVEFMQPPSEQEKAEVIAFLTDATPVNCGNLIEKLQKYQSSRQVKDRAVLSDLRTVARDYFSNADNLQRYEGQKIIISANASSGIRRSAWAARRAGENSSEVALFDQRLSEILAAVATCKK
jgi:hypothetical protein